MIDGRIEALMNVPTGVIGCTATAGGSPTSVPLPANAYYLSTPGPFATLGLLATLQAQLNAALAPGWTVSMSTGPTGTGQVTITSSTTPWSLAWTSTTLRDELGFTADIVAATTPQTGTSQARGLWIPDRPVVMDQDPRAAPEATDLRTTTSPTGAVFGLGGANVRYRHQNILWHAVATSRVWEGLATIPNASWQFFFRETQLGLGSSWFTPASPLQIYTHMGSLVGVFANAGAGTGGWSITQVSDIAPKLVSWTGQVDIALPELVSSG